MSMKHYSPIVKEIIETQIDKIEKNDFTSAIDQAIKEKVLEQLLDAFYEANIVVPPESVFDRLYESCFSTSTKLSSHEKEQKKLLAKYLINKQQVNVFKALGK